MDIPFKTHKYYTYEKYYSILVELLNLYKIIKIYENKNVLDSQISNVINTFKEELKEEYTHIQILEPKDFIEFLIRLDSLKQNLETKVYKIGLLHNKIIQSITESSPHITPLPPIQKRYSSKALSSLLKKHHNKLFGILSNNEGEYVSISSIWSHNDNYRIDSIDTTNHFSQHSFYYHDIAWTIPAVIDHEIILHAIQKNKTFEVTIAECSQTIKDSIEKTINSDLAIQKNKKSSFLWEKYYFEFQSFINTMIKNILWELAADLIGIELHGKGYVYSLFHETLGEYFGRDFIKKDGSFSKYLSLDIDKKRDSLLLRHMTIAALIKEDNDDKEYNEYIYYIKNLIKTFNPGNNIQNLYRYMDLNSKNARIILDNDTTHEIEQILEEAKSYQFLIFETYRSVLKDAIKPIGHNITSLNAELNEFKNSSPFFNDKGVSVSKFLWEVRNKELVSGSLPHRSLLRKELLCNLDIDGGHTFESYILYYRYTPSSMALKSNGSIAFGDYSKIHISPLQEKTIDICKKIDTCLNAFDEDQETYFETKHTLLKINHFSNSITSNDNKIKIYILVHLTNTKQPKDMVEMSDNMIEDTSITKYSNSISIYKSFGPEDIVIEATLKSIEDTWTFIETIRSKYSKEIRETFSNITIDNLSDSYQLNDDIWIKGFYRVTPETDFDTFYNTIIGYKQLKDLISNELMQIYNITDDYYDFEIWWTKTSLDIIDSFTKQTNIYNILIDSQHYMVSGKKITFKQTKDKTKPIQKGT